MAAFAFRTCVLGMAFVLGALLAPGSGRALDQLCLDEAPVCI